MAYVVGNPKTKKALKELVHAYHAGYHEPVRLLPQFIGTNVENGTEFVEGPHGVHKWYAEVKMKDGVIIGVK